LAETISLLSIISTSRERIPALLTINYFKGTFSYSFVTVGRAAYNFCYNFEVDIRNIIPIIILRRWKNEY